MSNGIMYATAPETELPEKKALRAVVLPKEIRPSSAVRMQIAMVALIGVLVTVFTWDSQIENGNARSRAYA